MYYASIRVRNDFYYSDITNMSNDSNTAIHYLFIDTETTGVPTNCYRNWDQCRLIQLGMIVKNHLFETVYENCLTVRYDGTNGTSDDALNVHGITDQSRLNATHGHAVCEEFINVALRCDVLVSHGTAFDFGVIFRECLLHRIDISCLMGKILGNTKSSEHYRGFRENLSQTIQRINPDWICMSEVLLNNDNRAHNALYDAHLCAELYRNSHHPSMNRPIQDLIVFLNERKYYNGIDTIRNVMEQKELQSMDVREEEDIVDDTTIESLTYTEDNENIEQGNDDSGSISWEEEDEEETGYEEILSSDIADEYAYQYESSSDGPTMEDYICSSVYDFCPETINGTCYHKPEDYA